MESITWGNVQLTMVNDTRGYGFHLAHIPKILGWTWHKYQATALLQRAQLMAENRCFCVEGPAGSVWILPTGLAYSADLWMVPLQLCPVHIDFFWWMCFALSWCFILCNCFKLHVGQLFKAKKTQKLWNWFCSRRNLLVWPWWYILMPNPCLTSK